MICSIEAFKNTSFTASNIPDSAQVLYSNFTPVSFPDCALLQNKYLATLRIATTFEQIDGVDYIVVIKNNIEKTFYFVTSITMINENCAELGLLMDAVTTVGINNINIVSGWATRCHTSTDNLFDNDLSEPFKPVHELVLDKSGILKPHVEDKSDLDVLGATFNVAGNYNKAKTFLDADNDKYVTTPVCPNFDASTENTKVNMSVIGGGTFENRLPETYLFEMSDAVKTGLMNARALGLDNGISCSYRIPKEYLGNKVKDGDLITTLSNTFQRLNSGIPFKFNSTYKPFNNKCYVLWNSFALMSTCSGERAEYTAKEVYENNENGNFTVNVFADLSPNGSPYFSPLMYLGANNVWQTAIKGMPWQNQPVAYDRNSGWYIQNQMKDIDYSQFINQRDSSLISTGLGTVDNALNIIQSSRNSASEHFINNQKKYLDYINKVRTGHSFSGRGASAITGLIDTEEESSYNFNRGMNAGRAGLGLAGTAISTAYSIQNMNLAQRKAVLGYNSGYINAPVVTFPRDESIQNFLGNFCYVTRTRLHDSDLRRLDTFFNMYGYAVDEPLTKSMFNSRKLFNYIECNNLDITVTGKDTPLYIRDLITQQLMNGVRIWHTKPSNNLFYVKNEVVS